MVPIVTLVTFVFPFNALSAMDVTLKVTPPNVTVFGMVTFVVLVFLIPANATVEEPVTLYLYLPEVKVSPLLSLMVNVSVSVPV